jgi:sulfonate transport system permease protein
MGTPLFHAVRQVPIIAFIPLLILFFDVEDSFKIVVVAAATFFPVALATMDAIAAIPKSHLEVARLYRLPMGALLWRVILPATVPPIITGFRLGLTRAWLSLVAAELLAADSGLGQMMEMGRQLFRIDVVMVGVIMAGVIGFLLDRSMVALEQRLGRWRLA